MFAACSALLQESDKSCRRAESRLRSGSGARPDGTGKTTHGLVTTFYTYLHPTPLPFSPQA